MTTLEELRGRLEKAEGPDYTLLARPDPVNGKRFGKLVVVGEVHRKDKGQARRFACLCDCGRRHVTKLHSLKHGICKSCGCLAIETMAAKNTRHGHAKRGKMRSEYVIWQGMKKRCGNPEFIEYHLYGGRGIQVCQRWLDCYDNFIADMGPRPSRKHSLDRIDSDGDYTPENCRWATHKEQVRNSRTVRPVRRGDGKQYDTIVDAAKDSGASAWGISATCKGKQKTAGGFSWEYL